MNHRERSERTPDAASSPAQRRFTITAKLAAIVVVFTAIIATLVGVMALSLYLTDSVRGHVWGEGLWSKGQKDAVYYLTLYARSGDERDYLKYRQALPAILGHRKARLELEKPEYDFETVKRGYVESGHPEGDVGKFIFLFRNFRDISFFRHCLELWRIGDAHIDELMGHGDELHAGITAGTLTEARRDQLLASIEFINATLTPLAVEFSSTLAGGARWMYGVLLSTLFALAALLLGAGLWVAWRIAENLHRGIRNLHEGAQQVAAGNLQHRIPATSRDELGDLARSFNEMIAHRHEAQEALEKERRFLKAVLDNVSEGIVACDEDGVLSFFNRAMRDLHGIPEQPLPPEAWAQRYSLYLPDGRTPMPKERNPLFRAFQGEVVRNEEVVIIPDGRSPRVLVASGQALQTPTGRKVGAVVAAHDITDRKRAETELADRADALARSNADLERFAFVASHDLQEPLRTVTSYTQLVARKFAGKGQREADELVGFITDAVQRMRDLIEGLLEYSRVQRQDGALAPTDLGGALQGALANLKQAIAGSGAEVTHGPLPVARVHPAQITQVFQNLVGNAIKFHGERPPKIHVTAERRGAQWLIRVRDDGIGIEPQYADRVFELFQKLHPRDTYPGNGLGLAICKKIVEHHGGRIWLEPGNPGTEIRFTLPALPDDGYGVAA